MIGRLRHALRTGPSRLGYIWLRRLASALRKHWVIVRNPHAQIRFGRIPPYMVALGIPARPIDYFGPPGEEPPNWDADPSDSPSDTASSQASR